MTAVPEQEKPENQDEDFKFRLDEVTGAKLPLVEGPILGMDDWGGGAVANSSTVKSDADSGVEEGGGEEENVGNKSQDDADGASVDNSSSVRNDEPADVEESDMKPEGNTSMDDVGGGSVRTSSTVNSEVDEDDAGGFAGSEAVKPRKRAARKS